MDKQLFEDDPGLDGPDYVALVIEWDELADTIERENPNQITNEITSERQTVTARTTQHPLRVFAMSVLGALGVIGFAVWGVRRLRAA
jgi:hypothetical protein